MNNVIKLGFLGSLTFALFGLASDGCLAGCKSVTQSYECYDYHLCSQGLPGRCLRRCGGGGAIRTAYDIMASSNSSEIIYTECYYPGTDYVFEGFGPTVWEKYSVPKTARTCYRTVWDCSEPDPDPSPSPSPSTDPSCPKVKINGLPAQRIKVRCNIN